MQCSTCSEPALVILTDRAFCEECYRIIQRRQRQVIDDMPLAPGAKPAMRGHRHGWFRKLTIQRRELSKWEPVDAR